MFTLLSIHWTFEKSINICTYNSKNWSASLLALRVFPNTNRELQIYVDFLWRNVLNTNKK